MHGKVVFRAGETGRRRATVAAVLAACLYAFCALLFSPAALAAKRAAEVQLESIRPSGTCTLVEPGSVAVDEATGDVYVVDKSEAKHRIDRFGPNGECLNAVVTTAPEFVVVDNSTTSAAKGDVFVSAAAEAASTERTVVKKFDSELKFIAQLKKWKPTPEPVFEEFATRGEILGLGVDAAGELFVHVPEAIDRFTWENLEKPATVTFVSETVVEQTCAFTLRGFAVTSTAENFYLGHERENRKEECELVEPSVLMKTDSEGHAVTEPEYKSQLDDEPTTGVSVDPENNNVYFATATSVSEFTAAGLFVERFGNTNGGPLKGPIKEGGGVAVDHAAHETVYVSDGDNHIAGLHGGEGVVRVFEPKTPEPAPVEASHGLPDGRAYEMVSPPNKLGAALYAITPELGVVQASANGDAITYTSNEPITRNPASNRAPEPSENLSRRGTSVWSTESIATPHPEFPNGYSTGTGTEYEFFTSDLSRAFVDPFTHGFPTNPTLLAPEATEGSPSVRSLTTPSTGCEPVPSACYQALVSPVSDNSGKPFANKEQFAGATPDGQHAVLTAQAQLTSESTGTAAEDLYEWEQGASAGGMLHLVSILPEGEAGEIVEPRLGAAGTGQTGGDPRHAISEDGTRVVWTNAPTLGPGEVPLGGLYLRDVAKGETLRLDKAQGVAEPETPGARFATASADGSRIFFTDIKPLTPNSTTTTEPEEEEGLGDLYVCEIVVEGGKDTCHLTDLTASVGAPSENAAVQGVIGANEELAKPSEDGTAVYFVADGVLSAQAGRGGCVRRTTAESDKEIEGTLPVLNCSLYVTKLVKPGEWTTPQFIATLTTAEERNWDEEPTRGALGTIVSRVSPSGNYLAFMSALPLTGYNNTDAVSGKRDEEVFEYNAETNKILCVSCNPNSAQQPHGVLDQEKSGEGIGLIIDQPRLWQGRWVAANIPGWTQRNTELALYQSRFLDNSGRLFFNSVDSLVPADTNGKADVYQYEPNGVGTCASTNGCDSLISGGESTHETAFMDASQNGESVFFLTEQQLTSQDKDTGYDIYAARECTLGSPCLNPPPLEAGQCATEEECKGKLGDTVPVLPPVPPTTASTAGNKGTHVVIPEEKVSEPPPGPTPHELLVKALKSCQKKYKHKTKKRKSCEKAARKKYAAAARRSSHRSAKGARR